MFYFKDENNGVGIASSQKLNGNVIWITKEEYEELLRAIEEDATKEANQ